MSWQDDVDELNLQKDMAREMGGSEGVAFQHGRTTVAPPPGLRNRRFGPASLRLPGRAFRAMMDRSARPVRQDIGAAPMTRLEQANEQQLVEP